MNDRLDPLEDVVGDLFVDRQFELNMYWDWATSIPNRPLNSFALIGRRRTGKTAILVKLFNRLFHEQERVVPVFISFAQYLGRTKPLTSYEFARDYFAGYLRSYLAFRYRRPRLLTDNYDLDRLRDVVHEVQDALATELLGAYDGIQRGQITSAHAVTQWVINMPRGYARSHNMPTAIIVDEFQVLTKAR